MAAVPELTTEPQHLEPIPGVVPDLRRLPPGCRFAPRCAFATAACDAEVPELALAGSGPTGQPRHVACIRNGELDEEHVQ